MEFIDFMLFAAFVALVFMIILLVYTFKFIKAQNKKSNDVIRLRKENLEIQKEILNEIKELRRDLNSNG